MSSPKESVGDPTELQGLQYSKVHHFSVQPCHRLLVTREIPTSKRKLIYDLFRMGPQEGPNTGSSFEYALLDALEVA